MNELMIVYGKGAQNQENWAYFRTNANNVKEAYDEYISAAEKAGINMDNMAYPTRVILRDSNNNDIDGM